MSFKGLPFIGKMNDFINSVLHATVQKVGHSSAALDVKTRAYYCINGTVTPYSVESGSTDNLLKMAGLNAKAGDIIRILSTANGIKEFEITVDSAPDANSAILAGYLSASLATGDTFHLLRPIVPLVGSDGASLATVISPPAQYNRKSAGTTLPVTVLEDLDTPSASRPMPVAIHSIDGAPINVSAGDISISLSHTNDSTAIGDGTRLVAVTTGNELKTSDATLAAKDFATQATLANVYAELLLKAKLTDTQPVSEGDVTVTGSITTQNLTRTGVATANSAIEIDCTGKSIVTIASSGSWTGTLSYDYTVDGVNWTSAVGNMLMQINNATYTGTIASGVSNSYRAVVAGCKKFRISGIAAMTGTANVTLIASKGNGMVFAPLLEPLVTAMSAKLPATLGQKTMSASMAVTLASDQASIPVTGPLTDTQLRASAVPISATSLPLPALASTSTNQSTLIANIGATNDAVSATDTGTASLISLIKKVAQNITTLMGKFPSALGQTTKSGSLSVTIASDQDTLNVKQAATSATYAESLTVAGSGVTTLTAPAGAKGCKVITPLSNTSYLNITLDGTTAPSSTVGMEIQGGRSEDFIGVGASLKAICQDAGTGQKISVHWYV